MFRMGSGMLYAADNGAGTGGTPGGSGGGGDQQSAGGTSGDQQSAPTFETWYAGLDAPSKTLFDGHVNGLRTALATERQEKSALAQQIRSLREKAEKGSDLERQLAEIQNTVQAAERRAVFAEDAIRPDIGCLNVKAAYALATADNLFDSRGRPDWTALKTTAPELFRKAGTGSGSADGGMGGQHAPKLDMNAIIRRAAGRG